MTNNMSVSKGFEIPDSLRGIRMSEELMNVLNFAFSDMAEELPTLSVNEEYFNAKNGSNPKKSLWIETESKEIKDKILNSEYSKTTKQNLLRIYEEVRNEVFGNSRIIQTINCSEVTATSYIKRMIELGIIAEISGQGKGKYRFIQ